MVGTHFNFYDAFVKSDAKLNHIFSMLANPVFCVLGGGLSLTVYIDIGASARVCRQRPHFTPVSRQKVLLCLP